MWLGEEGLQAWHGFSVRLSPSRAPWVSRGQAHHEHCPLPESGSRINPWIQEGHQKATSNMNQSKYLKKKASKKPVHENSSESSVSPSGWWWSECYHHVSIRKSFKLRLYSSTKSNTESPCWNPVYFSTLVLVNRPYSCRVTHHNSFFPKKSLWLV